MNQSGDRPAPESEQLERLVERLHRLVESDGAQVTWDDRIPDPDNPDQPRQIDITIRRDDKLTIVECRIHKAPQNVKWIEEMIGRRQSLRADAAIAVSYSGFTEGAIKKAKAHGIILRDFHTLSVEEVSHWGKQTVVELSFIQLTEVVITFSLAQRQLSASIQIDRRDGRPISWVSLLQKIVHSIADQIPFGSVASFEVDIESPELIVNGVTPTKVRVSGKAREIRQSLPLASVVCYADPVDESIVAAHVEKFKYGEFEIIQSSNESVSVVVDLSKIEIPLCSFFNTVNFDFGRIVTLRSVYPIGLLRAFQTRARIRFGFELV